MCETRISANTASIANLENQILPYGLWVHVLDHNIRRVSDHVPGSLGPAYVPVVNRAPIPGVDNHRRAEMFPNIFQNIQKLARRHIPRWV